MSFRHSIKTDKIINPNDVDDIVNHLPKKYQGILSSRTNWGWSCKCDIYLPQDIYLDIGGCYSICGEISEEFVQYICKKLEEKDYKVLKVNYDW